MTAAVIERYVVRTVLPIGKKNRVACNIEQFTVGYFHSVTVGTAYRVIPTVKYIPDVYRCGGQDKSVAGSEVNGVYSRAAAAVELHGIARHFQLLPRALRLSRRVHHFYLVYAASCKRYFALRSAGYCLLRSAVHSYTVLRCSDHAPPAHFPVAVLQRSAQRLRSYPYLVAVLRSFLSVRLYAYSVFAACTRLFRYRFRYIVYVPIRFIRLLSDLYRISFRAFYRVPAQFRPSQFQSFRRRQLFLPYRYLRPFRTVISLRLRRYFYLQFSRVVSLYTVYRPRYLFSFSVHFHDISRRVLYARPSYALRFFLVRYFFYSVQYPVVHVRYRRRACPAFRFRRYRELDSAFLHRAVRKVIIRRRSVVVSIVFMTRVSALHFYVISFRVLYPVVYQRTRFRHAEHRHSRQRLVSVPAFPSSRVLSAVSALYRRYRYLIVSRFRQLQFLPRRRQSLVHPFLACGVLYFHRIRACAFHSVPLYRLPFRAHQRRLKSVPVPFLFPYRVQRSVLFDPALFRYFRRQSLPVLVRAYPPPFKLVPFSSSGFRQIVQFPSDRLFVPYLLVCFVV